MLRKRFTKLVMGVLIVLLCVFSAGVLAAAPLSVSATIADYITFLFDGTSRPLPEGYTVLMYENRTYVPARFVAEQLDARVDWISATNTIMIRTKPCDSCKELADRVQELEAKIALKEQEIAELKKAAQEAERVDGQPSRIYERLPVTKRYTDFNITVTQVVEEENKNARVYVEVENKQFTPLQLIQRRSVAIVGGKEHKTEDVEAYLLDNRWFNNINQDEEEIGYLIFPVLVEDQTEMLLKITILYNDAEQRTMDLEFPIKY